MAGSALAVPLPVEKPDPPHREPRVTVSPCLSALKQLGVRATVAQGLETPGQCAVTDPIVLEAIETRLGMVRFPSGPILDCRFATVLADWIREVVDPLGAAVLGESVAAVFTGPGYQCRRRGSGAEARLSEHALGNAVDVSAVQLTDGRIVAVDSLTDVDTNTAEGEFMRAISASACGYFTTVLGPGSDPAHARHLHIDLAARTIPEFRICMAR